MDAETKADLRVKVRRRVSEYIQKSGAVQVEGILGEAFSERLNISRNHLARIEIGLRSASIEVLIAISEITNLTLDYLAMGKEPDHKNTKAELLAIAEALIRMEKEL